MDYASIAIENSLLVVPKGWILIGNRYAANPSAQHTTTAVGGLCGDWGVFQEHQRLQKSKTHANFGSILKTIYNILNVDYVNQYDITASLLQDFLPPNLIIIRTLLYFPTNGFLIRKKL
ncbi:hypothetical protein BH20BAC1_BH20BAC1_28900 [soil metagenome]